MSKFEKIRKEQIKFYTNLLKENEILLLNSKDAFFKNHYKGSPLNVLTNFSGTEGEAVIEKNGKITIFVDTRYHILVDKQVFSEIDVVKMPLGEKFVDAISKKFQKNTIMYVLEDVLLSEYLELDKHFDLRKYSIPEKYIKNYDIHEKKPIYLVDKKIEKHDFGYKIQKYEKIRNNIEKTIIFNLDEISYLTNLRSFKSSYSSNFKSILYLDFKNSNYILFVENLDEFKNITIEKLKILSLSDFFGYINSIEDEIYIDYKNISLKQFLAIKKPKQIKVNNLSVIASIKPMSVIEHLKEASKKLDVAIYNFKNQLKEGLSEVDLVEIFERELLKAGAFAPSFKTILAINENSASIHYSSYDKEKKLKPESIVLLDCGGYYEAGYATDITRTFYFGKNPKPIHKKIYTAVLKAFLACYNSKNSNAFELDKLARSIVSPFFTDGFNFDHGLGHGIGTSVHQNPPRLSNTSKDIIKPYQVHSIEPGLYGKSKEFETEFGVRIENCVYSDLNYNKISLSKFPFEGILIDSTMLNINELEQIQKWQKEFEI